MVECLRIAAESKAAADGFGVAYLELHALLGSSVPDSPSLHDFVHLDSPCRATPMGEFQRLPGPQNVRRQCLTPSFGPTGSSVEHRQPRRMGPLPPTQAAADCHPPQHVSLARRPRALSFCLSRRLGRPDVLGKTDSGTAGDMAACISRVQKPEAGNVPISFTLPTCLKFGLLWPLLSLPSHCHTDLRSMLALPIVRPWLAPPRPE